MPVEVKGKYEQKINETSVADANWGKSHWGSIQQNYSKATYFKENQEWVKELYLRTDYNSITDINLAFIKAINAFLEITTRIMDSREFELRGDKTEKLANICVDLKASSYITGPAAKAYMSESVFTDVGIQIEYSDYSDYPEYEQLFTPFEHGVSILDLIFNLGIEKSSLNSYGSTKLNNLLKAGVFNQFIISKSI